MDTIKDKTAIVGIGVHEFSKDSGRTEWDMACRSVKAALDEAGLTPEDIDGIVEQLLKPFFAVGEQEIAGVFTLWDEGELDIYALREADFQSPIAASMPAASLSKIKITFFA